MDHDTVVRDKMTERYLLNELDPRARDDFEEHFFDCQECALDVHSGSVLIEQTKVELAKDYAPADTASAVPVPVKAKPGWGSWFPALFRPAVVIPVMAMLLAVVAYQNLVTFPKMQSALQSPQILPWVPVNVGTYGSGDTIIKTNAGEGFLLFVRIPPEGIYSQYTAELYNPTGKVEWKVTIPASSTQDQWPLRVPGGNRESGMYSLAVRGVTSSGEVKEIGRASFELQVQK